MVRRRRRAARSGAWPGPRAFARRPATASDEATGTARKTRFAPASRLQRLGRCDMRRTARARSRPRADGDRTRPISRRSIAARATTSPTNSSSRSGGGWRKAARRRQGSCATPAASSRCSSRSARTTSPRSPRRASARRVVAEPYADLGRPDARRRSRSASRWRRGTAATRISCCSAPTKRSRRPRSGAAGRRLRRRRGAGGEPPSRRLDRRRDHRRAQRTPHSARLSADRADHARACRLRGGVAAAAAGRRRVAWPGRADSRRPKNSG